MLLEHAVKKKVRWYPYYQKTC